MANTPGNYLTAYQFGTGKFVLHEFDVPMNAADEFNVGDFDAELLANGVSQYTNVLVQTQLAGATTEFPAKFCLAENYDLGAGEGQKLTPLSQISLQAIEFKHFKLIATESGINVHFTVFG